MAGKDKFQMIVWLFLKILGIAAEGHDAGYWNKQKGGIKPGPKPDDADIVKDNS